ncbi:MAG: hypothetical protein H7Y38_02560 [Armatimonadetes bacterium]|nr:hypothetical protein [Armatimonadota bacterium]
MTDSSPSPEVSPSPDFIDKANEDFNKFRKSRTQPNQPVFPVQRPVDAKQPRLVGSPSTVTSDSSEEQALAQWQQEIALASATVSDAEIAVRYSLLVLALDTKNDQETAQLIQRITATPQELEVMLYRISPEMRTALWNRLPLSRTNAILNNLPTGKQGVLARYFGELNKIGLAPGNAVPWNRIP